MTTNRDDTGPSDDDRPTAEVDGQPEATGDLRAESEPASRQASEEATDEAEALDQPGGS